MNKQRFLIMSFVLIFSFTLVSIARAEAMGKKDKRIKQEANTKMLDKKDIQEGAGYIKELLAIIPRGEGDTQIAITSENLTFEARQKLIQKHKCTDVSENKEVFIKIENDELNLTGVKISFFDKNDKLLGVWEYKGQAMERYHLSDKGKYCIVELHDYKRIKIANKDEFLKKVFIIDNTGKEIGCFETYGVVWGWSPNEDYFLSMEGDGEDLRAHDILGKIIWERKKPNDISYQGSIKISSNGKYIFLCEDDSKVILLTNKGKLLFKKEFEVEKNKFGSKYIRLWDIDDSGNIIITPTGIKKNLFIVDNKGNIKYKKKIDFEPYEPVFIKFSTENKNEILVQEHKRKGVTKIKWIENK